MIKIEKLCGKDYKNEGMWCLTHVRFCRINNLVRLDNKKTIYKCVSNPIWSKADRAWDMKFKIAVMSDES